MRSGFTLLEIVPVLSVVVILMTIIIVAINPVKQFGDAHNVQRKQDINLIADAIAAHTLEKNRSLFLNIPTGTAIEICGDTITGNCEGLLDLRLLIPGYLDSMPIDPTSEDPDSINKFTRYFISRTTQRFTITAPDTEPLGDPDISVSR